MPLNPPVLATPNTSVVEIGPMIPMFAPDGRIGFQLVNVRLRGAAYDPATKKWAAADGSKLIGTVTFLSNPDTGAPEDIKVNGRPVTEQQAAALVPYLTAAWQAIVGAATVLAS